MVRFDRPSAKREAKTHPGAIGTSLLVGAAALVHAAQE
jgi:hypothetical protein